jgi:dihydroorotase-like cyclic amidohydrolase
MLSTIIRGGDVVVPHVGVLPLDIAIDDGKIAALLARGTSVAARQVVDAGGLTVFPGAIDPHVHQDITSSGDAWFTETRSAAVGGVTTLLDFRISRMAFSRSFAEDKARAEASSMIDFGFQFIMTLDEQLEETERCGREFGAPTFKMLMSFKGAEGAYLGASGTDDGFLFSLMEKVATIPAGMVSLHTENIEVVWKLRDRLMKAGRNDLAAFTESRPPFVEAEDVHKAIHYGHVTGCPVHIVHLTSKESLEAVRHARRQYPGVKVTVETCPQYLTHTVDSPAGILARINPPVKYREDMEALWDGLFAGEIDTIGTDHCSRDLKAKLGDSGGVNVWKAQSSFPGLATMLPLMLSEGYHKRGLPLHRIAELTSANAAKLYGLWPRKGSIQVGFDADLVLVDLDKTQTVTPALLQSSCDWTIWEGWPVRGWPVATYVRGRAVLSEGRIVGERGHGRYLHRPVQG